MGAQSFYETAKGKTPEEAFDLAREESRFMYGHGGYTGSLAEKDSYRVIDVPKGKDPAEFVEELMENDDKRIRDKWGPAGCVLLSSEIITREVEVPQTAKSATSKTIAHTGARKWVTYHVLYSEDKLIGKYEKKADATKFGKEYALKKNKKVTMKLEKHLVGSNPIELEISPNVPKPKTKKVKEPQNKYVFFGWASS